MRSPRTPRQALEQRSPADGEKLRLRATELRECLRKDISEMDRDLQELRQKAAVPLASIGSLSPDKTRVQTKSLKEEISQTESSDNSKMECLPIIDGALVDLNLATDMVKMLIKGEEEQACEDNQHADNAHEQSPRGQFSTKVKETEALRQELATTLDAKRSLERDLAKESERIWALLKELDMERARCETIAQEANKEKANSMRLHELVQAYNTRCCDLHSAVEALEHAKNALAATVENFTAELHHADSAGCSEHDALTHAGSTPSRDRKTDMCTAAYDTQGASEKVEDVETTRDEPNRHGHGQQKKCVGPSSDHEHEWPNSDQIPTCREIDNHALADVEALLLQERERTRRLEKELCEQKERNLHLVKRAQSVTHDQFVKHTQLVNESSASPGDRLGNSLNQVGVCDRLDTPHEGLVDKHYDPTCTDTSAHFLLSNSDDAADAFQANTEKLQDRNKAYISGRGLRAKSEVCSTGGGEGQRRSEDARGTVRGYLGGPEKSSNRGRDVSEDARAAHALSKPAASGERMHAGGYGTLANAQDSIIQNGTSKYSQGPTSLQSGCGDTTDVSGFSGDEASHVLPT
jgi:hypothetical protein